MRRDIPEIRLLETTKAQHVGDFYSMIVDVPNDAANDWLGTIKWVWKSTYRPNHKRKNWFLQIIPAEIEKSIEFSDKDVIIQTMRAGGPGGQYVNKTESAVRAIHQPTQIEVVIADERSQAINKQRALEELRRRVTELNAKLQKKNKALDRHTHYELERGNPVKTFLT
jgi:peptide chain release factor